LGFINIALAVFNLIPGYPLDGGRVLRAIAWRFTGNTVLATRIAASAGQFIAAAFIIFGLLRFLAGAGIGSLWIAFIGWFLSQAASASYMEIKTAATLSGVRVGDVMAHDCPPVDGNVNLRTFVDDYLLRTGRRCYIVRENGRNSGLVSVHELKQIERQRWPFTTVSEIVLPLAQVRTVGPDTSVTKALEYIVHEDVNQLPVVSNGEVVGVISRGNVLQFLQTRAELKAA
jgi:predicted transcriptional regulator